MRGKFPLVALVGLAGSGKSEVCKQFESSGFIRVYFGKVTLDYLKSRGLPVNEKNERQAREKLRAEGGMEVYAKLNLPVIKEAWRTAPVIADGLYSWEEFTFLRRHLPSMQVVAVYASPETRYKRLANRPVRPLDRDQAVSRDYTQIENTHQGGPIAMADFTIMNEGNLIHLRKQIKEVIDHVKKN